MHLQFRRPTRLLPWPRGKMEPCNPCHAIQMSLLNVLRTTTLHPTTIHPVASEPAPAPNQPQRPAHTLTPSSC